MNYRIMKLYFSKVMSCQDSVTVFSASKRRGESLEFMWANKVTEKRRKVRANLINKVSCRGILSFVNNALASCYILILCAHDGLHPSQQRRGECHRKESEIHPGIEENNKIPSTWFNRLVTFSFSDSWPSDWISALD